MHIQMKVSNLQGLIFIFFRCVSYSIMNRYLMQFIFWMLDFLFLLCLKNSNHVDLLAKGLHSIYYIFCQILIDVDFIFNFQIFEKFDQMLYAFFVNSQIYFRFLFQLMLIFLFIHYHLISYAFYLKIHFIGFSSFLN